MPWHRPPGGGGGYSYEFLLGVCRPVLHILTLFQIKTCHTRFQTWPLKSIPVFRLGIGRNYVIIYNKIKTLTKRFLTIHFEFAYYSFFHFHLELKRQIRSCAPVFPSKPYPNSDQNKQSLYSFSEPKRTKTDQNGAKTIPFGATHAYEANTGSTPPRANHTEISLSLSLSDTHIGLP